MQLYKWQKECLSAWEKNQRRGIAHVITGAGKTVLALEAIRRALTLHPDTAVKIVVPFIPLARQWENALLQDPRLAQLRPGFFGGGRRDDPASRLMIYIVPSARNYLAAHIRQELALGRHVLLICDECHHCASPQNRKIFDFLNTAILSGNQYSCLGLSATPLETESGALLVHALGPVIYRYGFEAGVRENVLSPFAVCEVSSSFSASELQEYGRLSSEIALQLQHLHAAYPTLKKMEKRRFLQAVSHIAHQADMDPAEPAAAFLLKTYQRKQVTVSAASRVRCALALLLRLHPTDRVLIFSERIAQAEEMAAAIRRRMGDICVIYHSRMTRDARERNLQAFRENRARVLVSCRCLDEGIDVPDANIGIVLSGSAVERQHIQRLGRLLRRAPGKAAACLYHISIREAPEDLAFLPVLTSCERFSLRYLPAEDDFSSDLYEYACSNLLRSASERGMSSAFLREYRACLMEGLTRADWLLAEDSLEEHIQTAGTQHEKNYWRAMEKLRKNL